MATFSALSQERLATCDSRLQAILNEAIKRINIVVLVGHRNKEDQEKAFAEGKSQKHWPHGNHNSLPSRAVDIAPYVPGPKIDWRDVPAFGRMMGYVQRIADEMGIRLRFGMDWDMDFRTVGFDPDEHFLDAPHVELLDP